MVPPREALPSLVEGGKLATFLLFMSSTVNSWAAISAPMVYRKSTEKQHEKLVCVHHLYIHGDLTESLCNTLSIVSPLDVMVNSAAPAPPAGAERRRFGQ